MPDVAKLTADLIAAKKQREASRREEEATRAAWLDAQAQHQAASKEVNRLRDMLDKETDKEAGVKGDGE